MSAGTSDESGCGQSVPHSMRCGFASINALASGPTSGYDGAAVELRYGAESFT